MSGGSFDYLYRKTLGEALQVRGTTEEMAEALERTATIGYYGGKPQGQPVAAVAAELRAILAEADALAARWERLAPVLKAMEWTRSMDWCGDDVGKAAAELATKAEGSEA